MKTLWLPLYLMICLLLAASLAGAEPAQPEGKIQTITLPADLELIAAPRFYQQDASGKVQQVSLPQAPGAYYVTSLLLNRGPGSAKNVKVIFVAETPHSQVEGTYVEKVLLPGQTVLVSTLLQTTASTQNVAIYVEPAPGVADPDLLNNGALVVVPCFAPAHNLGWLLYVLLACAIAGLVYVLLLRALTGGRGK